MSMGSQEDATATAYYELQMPEMFYTTTIAAFLLGFHLKN